MTTYKFRLYPNKKQQDLLWRDSCKLNFLYNYFLDQKIKAYKESKINISRFDLDKQIPELKKDDKILKGIHSQVTQQVPKRLDNAFQNFFSNLKRGILGFPKFRSCKFFFSLIYSQVGYKLVTDKFITKQYGVMSFVKHRNIQGNIKTLTIKNEGNQWFICVVTDHIVEKTNDKENQIGIDLGITNLVALSNGVIIKNKGDAKYFDKQINNLKSRKDKCKKGSNKNRFFSKVINRLYGVKSRKINDFQHKVSKNLSKQFDTIFIEKLETKKMSEGKITGLNRELRNSKLSSFISMLKYKSFQVVEVNPRNTSKTCNSCGGLQKMPLYKRLYSCKCGYKEDRDVNAAKNILCLGQAILKGCSVKATIQEVPALAGGSSQ